MTANIGSTKMGETGISLSQLQKELKANTLELTYFNVLQLKPIYDCL